MPRRPATACAGHARESRRHHFCIRCGAGSEMIAGTGGIEGHEGDVGNLPNKLTRGAFLQSSMTDPSSAIPLH